jgi:hypothetical protein
MVRMIGVVILWSLLLQPAAFAEHNKGRGRDRQDRTEKIANEAMDGVADELLDEKGKPSASGAKGVPPGLAKKGKMPPGLAKQGKTPPGWSKGEKTGWDGAEEQPSPLRRLIRGIFRKAKQPAQPPSAPAPQ